MRQSTRERALQLIDRVDPNDPVEAMRLYRKACRLLELADTLDKAKQEGLIL